MTPPAKKPLEESQSKENAHKSLIIVDGFGFVFRAYHVQPPLTAPDGRPVGAIYGFTSMLLKLINDFKPQEAVIVLDSPGKNFRHEIYPEYKANRPPAPEDLIEQLKLIRVAAEALNFKVLEKPGYEADDIIATLARQASKSGKDAIIVSSDKDLMQLMDDNVKMYDAAKSKFLQDEDVEKKFGVGPDKVREVQALIGDKSDNIPGIRGVGPKTASELIKEFSDLEGIYESLDKISSASKRSKIEQGKEDAFLSWKLVGLDDQVDLHLNCRECAWSRPSENQIGEFLINNGFKSLIKRAEKIFNVNIDGQAIIDFSKPSHGVESSLSKNESNSSDDDIAQGDNKLTKDYDIQIPEIDELKIKTIYANNINELQEIIDLAAKEGIASIYLENNEESGSYAKNKKNQSQSQIHFENTDEEISSISLCINVSNQTCLIESKHFYKYGKFDEASKYLTLIKEFLEDKSIKKITYDLKPIIKYFDSIKISAAEDLILMDYALNAGKKTKSMREVFHEYLSIDLGDAEADPETSKPAENNEEGEEVAGQDIKRAKDIANKKYCFLYYMRIAYLKLKQELISQKIYHLYTDLDLPVCYILNQMEKSGIKIDKTGLAKLSAEFQSKITKLEKQIYNIAGEEFNVSSTKQLGVILFDKMQLPFKKNSAKSGGYSTGSEILEKLSLEGHAIADLILEYRHLTKLKNTYTDVLPKLAQGFDSRIHTTYQQNQTSTSRLSSKDPNVQNIPIRTEEGNKIRSCFVAREGYKLISADYSQIELRILSHVANIPELQKAFTEGQDIHKKTASQIFDVPLDEVDANLRYKAKAINFGIIYGISAFGLAKQLNCSKADAASYIKRYFENYPGIEEYMKNTIEFAHKNGFVENILGRKSYIPLINNRNHAMKAYGERAAINAPLQSLNADIVKIAMINLSKEFKNRGLETLMLLQIHDELIFEAPLGEVETVMPLIKQIMEGAISLSVPTKVDINSGNNWQEVH